MKATSALFIICFIAVGWSTVEVNAAEGGEAIELTELGVRPVAAANAADVAETDVGDKSDSDSDDDAEPLDGDKSDSDSECESSESSESSAYESDVDAEPVGECNLNLETQVVDPSTYADKVLGGPGIISAKGDVTLELYHCKKFDKIEKKNKTIEIVARVASNDDDDDDAAEKSSQISRLVSQGNLGCLSLNGMIKVQALTKDALNDKKLYITGNVINVRRNVKREQKGKHPKLYPRRKPEIETDEDGAVHILSDDIIINVIGDEDYGGCCSILGNNQHQRNLGNIWIAVGLSSVFFFTMVLLLQVFRNLEKRRKSGQKTRGFPMDDQGSVNQLPK